MGDSPSAGDLLLAVLRSSLPDIEARTLMSLISWGSYRDWTPRRATLEQVAERARLDRRTVQTAVAALKVRGLLKNLSPVGWVPEWQLEAEAIASLPSGAPEAKPARERRTTPRDPGSQGGDPGSHPHDPGSQGTPAILDHTPMIQDHRGAIQDPTPRDPGSQGGDPGSYISRDPIPGSIPGILFPGSTREESTPPKKRSPAANDDTPIQSLPAAQRDQVSQVIETLQGCQMVAKSKPINNPVKWILGELKANPAVNLPTEINKADAWCMANGSRGHKHDWAKFLHNWFSRAQDDSGRRGYNERSTQQGFMARPAQQVTMSDGKQITRNAFGGREEVADFTAFFGGRR